MRLIAIKNKYNPNNIGIITNLNSYAQEIERLHDRINVGYPVNKKEVDIELTGIENDIENFMNETADDILLYKYCERMLMFLNKYRNEHQEIAKQLDQIESDFNEKKIDISIEGLILLGNKIKENGREYGVKIE
jgi:septation ring formation regulator EzrA